MAELSILSPNAGRRFDLLAYGDPNVDYVFDTDRIPLADEKVLGHNLGVFLGGTVANVACAASRLGARSASYGRVGDDEDGLLLVRDNEAFGVSNAFVSTVKHRTSAAMIMVDASGEKALVYAPMPIAPLDEARLTDALKNSRIVYSMPYDIDEFRRISTLARQCGTDVTIDIEAAVAPDQQRLDALLGCSDIVFMNEGGFRATSQLSVEPDTIRPLLDKGPRLIIVTMGAKGAIAVTRELFVKQPAFATEVVDATGAGDCFNGAFLAAALSGQQVDACLTYACAAASFSISKMGARTGIPTHEQTSEFAQVEKGN